MIRIIRRRSIRPMMRPWGCHPTVCRFVGPARARLGGRSTSGCVGEMEVKVGFAAPSVGLVRVVGCHTSL